MVIDVITYNGERELFDLRYSILKDYVDEFIVCEAPLTFSGKPKPLYFKEIKGEYGKVRYYVIDEDDPKLWEMARRSPNTTGADHWKREFVHKESIKKALTHLQDDDVVFIGDCDEIWNPAISLGAPPKPLKLKLKVYTYFLNNRSSEEFWGMIVSKYSGVKDECLNHLRTNAYRTELEYGWHFTSMGGYEEVKRKLSDSYTRESYWTEHVENSLRGNIARLTDFLGRGFTYTKDESEWPEYLQANKEKWKHLLI